MSKNIISIVIPVFNGEKFIKETIESCINQTYKEIEIVVVDDFSSDKSVGIIEKFSDDRISLYKNDQNLGLIDTINKGINLSRGTYVLPLGQDDLLSDNHIESMITYFDEDTSIVFCGSIIIDSNGIEMGYSKYYLKHKKFDTYNLSLRNSINSCGLILNKAKFILVGGYSKNENYKNFGEWDLWIRLSKLGTIKYCDKVKSYYRRHDNNISNTFNQRQGLKKMYNYCINCMLLGYKIGDFTISKKIVFYFYYIRYTVRTFIKYLVIRFSN